MIKKSSYRRGSIFSSSLKEPVSFSERSLSFLHHMCALRYRLCCTCVSLCSACLLNARTRLHSEKGNANHLPWHGISARVSANEPTCTVCIAEHHSDICKHTFESIFNDSSHKLRKLLPPLHESKYNLRHACSFSMPCCTTNRFKNSFIMASCALVNTA